MGGRGRWKKPFDFSYPPNRMPIGVLCDSRIPIHFQSQPDPRVRHCNFVRLTRIESEHVIPKPGAVHGGCEIMRVEKGRLRSRHKKISRIRKFEAEQRTKSAD